MLIEEEKPILQLIFLFQRLNRQTRIWHSLSHKNIMPFLGLCYDLAPCPVMISPLYDNADVHRYLADRPDDRLEVVSLCYVYR
jgi:hypothetical protein